MNADYNNGRPLIMHIDLNSCFATVEQQARVRLRGRPVAIVNRRTEHTMIVTCSYEAKALGVQLGMSVKEARKLAPNLIALESDPAKYRFVYHRLMDIMNDYSAHVRMKSIDEGVIDFTEATEAVRGRDLRDIGEEIKRRLCNEVGRAMRCNIGISTNRFLAKTAASLHKPDGLDVIDASNLRDVLGDLKLTDLTGIAHRFEKRLNAVGIYTPLEFLDATPESLHSSVFHSINGDYWHQRLRGWEVDKRDFPLKSAGRQFVLDGYRLPYFTVLKRLHHLCEDVGTKIRSQGMVARGVLVYVRTYDYGGWHAKYMAPVPFFSNQAIYTHARRLFEGAPDGIKMISITCYELSEDNDPQLSLFGDELSRERDITSAVDEINQRYGKNVIHSADTVGMGEKIVKQKIPFGSTRYM